jgi:hypothetical protein
MLNMKASNRTRQEVIEDYFFLERHDDDLMYYELVSRNKFQLTPLSKCYTDDGQTYKEAYPDAFFYTDEDGEVIPHDYSTLSFTIHDGEKFLTIFAETPPVLFDGGAVGELDDEIDMATRVRIADIVVEAWRLPLTELGEGFHGVRLPNAIVVIEVDEPKDRYSDIDVVETTTS